MPSPTNWELWPAHLAARKSPAALPTLLETDLATSLLWGVDTAQRAGALGNFMNVLKQKRSTSSASATIAQLTWWRATLVEQPAGLELGLTAIAWTHLLPELAASLSAESWQGLLADLLKLASDAAALNPVEQPLAHQLLAVELPLTLAYQFPELPECIEQARSARKLWAWGAEELTDGEGLPAGENLALMKPLLACWTRLMTLSRALPEPTIDEDTQVQFEWLLRQTVRLMRPDGSLVFTPESKTSDMQELATAALRQIADPEDHLLVKCAFRGVEAKKASPKKPKAGKKGLPEPFIYSEWSKTGLLRSDWSLGAPRLAVTYDRRRVQCELSSDGQVLLSGLWTPEVGIDGWNWTPENEWEEVCWHTDEDVVYLEIETSLNSGWKIQRQILLARKERFVLLADAVVGDQPAQLTYRSVLPLPAGRRFLPSDETREGYLAGKRTQALVLPLALPEWRSESGGELQATEAGLQLTQAHHGSRLFAPLFIDLDPQRLRKECTWRQLTVAELLVIQPRDSAVAYRVQIGSEQWSVYRSLGPKGNRTFLGHNVVSECQVAKFLKDGSAEVILEVE
ncbi:MAG TPA: hypothetical protein VL096_21945 [Pirellulaceae bacterium]|nr:hypothetical protein [Pirellulaceae bacterium]